MEPNTHSAPPAPRGPDGLATVATGLEQLATQDLDQLPDHVRAQRVMELQGLADRLEGLWLRELAGVDAHGAAGADDGTEIGSTAAGLRGRLRLGGHAASSAVRPSWRWWWGWTACWAARAPWVESWGGRGRWTPRPVGGRLVMGR